MAVAVEGVGPCWHWDMLGPSGTGVDAGTSGYMKGETVERELRLRRRSNLELPPRVRSKLPLERRLLRYQTTRRARRERKAILPTRPPMIAHLLGEEEEEGGEVARGEAIE
jgi:hypothetical protein